MKLVIYHTYYGCDSGCCGHRVETKDGDPRKFAFTFDHARSESAEDKALFAAELVGEGALKDVDWEASDVRDYSC